MSRYRIYYCHVDMYNMRDIDLRDSFRISHNVYYNNLISQAYPSLLDQPLYYFTLSNTR